MCGVRFSRGGRGGGGRVYLAKTLVQHMLQDVEVQMINGIRSLCCSWCNSNELEVISRTKTCKGTAMGSCSRVVIFIEERQKVMF